MILTIRFYERNRPDQKLFDPKRDQEQSLVFNLYTELSPYHTQIMYPELCKIIPLSTHPLSICLGYLDCNENKKISNTSTTPFMYKFPYRSKLYDSRYCFFCNQECYHMKFGIYCIECDTHVCVDCLYNCLDISKQLPRMRATILFQEYLYREFEDRNCVFQCSAKYKQIR